MKTEKYPLLPVLIVDDEKQVLVSYKVLLGYSGINNVLLCHDSREVETILSEYQIGIVLLDLSMPYVSGNEILLDINLRYPEIPVIIITGENEIDTAVECMRSGAFDYMVKPVESSRFISGVKRAVELIELRHEYSILSEHMLSDTLGNPEAFSEIVTNNQKMLTIFKYIESISMTSKPVLVTGETGVGKEMIPRVIHELSGKSGEYVAVNVAGLDDNVFSDTLFGHLKGAYTGAEDTRAGLIEKASGGTLFLDEIGELNMQSQIKLLRLLQEREYFPLGSDMPKTSDARIVVATNRDLTTFKETGAFRNDLYYRLVTHHIHIPPLRDRIEDIPFLVDHFLDKTAHALKKKKPTVPDELYTYLATYHFPGNIRELESMVFDAVSSHKSRMLSMDVFKVHIQKESLSESHHTDISSDAVLPLMTFPRKFPTLKEASNYLVRDAVSRAEGNRSIAAQMLGISRPALSKRIKNLEIQDDTAS